MCMGPGKVSCAGKRILRARSVEVGPVPSTLCCGLPVRVRERAPYRVPTLRRRRSSLCCTVVVVGVFSWCVSNLLSSSKLLVIGVTSS